MKKIIKIGFYFFHLINFVYSQNVGKIYFDSNYSGRAKTFEILDYEKMGSFNDKVSSIKIKSGYQIIIFEHGKFRGRSKILTGSQSNLKDFDFNDKISSMKVEELDRKNEPVVSVYYDSGYRGRYNFFGIGEFSTIWPNDRVSSIKVDKGYTIEVFTDSNFKGKSKIFNNDISKLTSLNDKISSIKVYSNGTTDNVSKSKSRHYRREVAKTNNKRTNNNRSSPDLQFICACLTNAQFGKNYKSACDANINAYLGFNWETMNFSLNPSAKRKWDELISNCQY